MDKPIEDPAKETKERIRDLIIAILPYQEFDRAVGASKVANHLIDELVARVQMQTKLTTELTVMMEETRQRWDAEFTPIVERMDAWVAELKAMQMSRLG